MPASLETRVGAVEEMRVNASPSAGAVQRVNPLEETGWDAALQSCAGAGFFHTRAWAAVLQATYGYTPRYYALRAGGRLLAALPLMEVESWLTGRRGVSLPFTDDCEPLSVDEDAFRAVFQAALEDARTKRWKYLELRGGKQHFPEAPAAATYYGHQIDLGGPADALFAKVESSVRRAIRKAEASVRVEIAQDLNATRIFYRLQCQTRQRHGVPPQTFGFFKNIQQSVLAQNKGFIVVARYQDRPVAAAVFFQFGTSAIFKYGASDERFQQTRANNLVMWEAIQWHARNGFTRLSLGRTALGNGGLRRFKRGWGSEEQQIEYLKYDRRQDAFVTAPDESTGWSNRVLQRAPVGLARLIGAVLYKHVA